MQKGLIVIGALILLAGLLWPWLGKIPFGRLPGDIVIDRPHLKIYIPVTTMVLVSAVLSLLLWLFRK
jgi:membrane protein implicated in regulation of membrane protease activity